MDSDDRAEARTRKCPRCGCVMGLTAAEKVANITDALRHCDRCGKDEAQFCQGCMDDATRKVSAEQSVQSAQTIADLRETVGRDRPEAERIAFNAWHSTRCVECAADPEWTNCSSLTNEFEAYREGLRAGRVEALEWCEMRAVVHGDSRTADDVTKRLAAAKGGGDE